MTKTSKVQQLVILYFPCTLFSQPTHSSSGGGWRPWRQPQANRMGAGVGVGIWAPGVAAREATLPATHRRPMPRPTPQAPNVGAPLFPPGSFREKMLMLLLVLHIHIPKPRNSDPLPGDLGLPHCYTSAGDGHLRQTSIQDELPDCCPGEPALQPHATFAAGKTGLNAKQMLFSRSLLGARGRNRAKKPQ